MLPTDVPPMSSVRYYFDTWNRDGTFIKTNDTPRKLARHALNRDPEPSISVLDSQSVRSRRRAQLRWGKKRSMGANGKVGLIRMGQAPITTCEQNEPAFLLQPQIGLLISMPRASSYTEKTSCFCARNHCATAGPVHSSTRKRIYVGSSNGTNVVFARDFVANNKHA